MDAASIPETPKRRENLLAAASMMNLKLRRPLQNSGDVDIDTNDHRTIVEIECGTMQPGRRIWTESFFLGICKTGDIQLTGFVYAANLKQPQEFALTAVADITETSMTVDELIDLAGAVNDECDDTG